MPMPSPIRVPSASLSKGRMFPDFDRAGVLLKHRYMKIVFSASQPPTSMVSERRSSSSLTAARTAPSELAHAASTVMLMPPRSSRLATRPATTLPSMPGKEFSSHGAYARRNLAAISSASRSVRPQLRTTSLMTGVWRRAVSGWVSWLAPVMPRTTPVREASYQGWSAPASLSRSRATTRLRSWRTSVTSRVFGGRPNSSGLNGTSGMKPPRRE